MKAKKISVTPRRRRLLRMFLTFFVLSMCSCQVVRTITTSAETRQEDDKTIIIQTKTIETYSGEKKV